LDEEGGNFLFFSRKSPTNCRRATPDKTKRKVERFPFPPIFVKSFHCLFVFVVLQFCRDDRRNQSGPADPVPELGAEHPVGEDRSEMDRPEDKDRQGALRSDAFVACFC
jgi:hypothetical protein